MKQIFIFRLCVYFLCLILSFYGLNALDFQRLLKRHAPVYEAWILYFLLAVALAFVSAQFFMGIMIVFQESFQVNVH